jgi:hypothetical protein
MRIADLDLRTRLKNVRDHIGLIMLLVAGFGVWLARYGINWAAISAMIPTLVLAYVVLSYLRVRLFPTWRLLELCLYPGRWFGAVRVLWSRASGSRRR